MDASGKADQLIQQLMNHTEAAESSSGLFGFGRKNCSRITCHECMGRIWDQAGSFVDARTMHLDLGRLAIWSGPYILHFSHFKSVSCII